MKSSLIHDLINCTKIAFYIASGAAVFFTLIYLIFYNNGDANIFVFIKNSLYYIGCFGFLISAAFFIKRDGTRPLHHEEQWKKHFHRFNLGFVVMWISLFICIFGMLIQLILEILL